MISGHEEKLVNDLAVLIDSIIIILNSKGEDTSKGYDYLRKVDNILANKDLNGMKKIKRHLFMDFRMIRDRQIDAGELGEKMNEAYTLAKSHSLFNN